MKIKKISIHPLQMPLVHPYHLSNAYGTLEKSDQVLVEINTDEGIIGWGEGNPWAGFTGDISESVVCILEKIICPSLIGKDPTNINEIHRTMDLLISGNSMAKAPIDMACYDIFAKSLKIPLHKLLGGSNYKSIKCFWSVGGSTPLETASEVLDIKKRGFWGCMIKVGTDYKNDIERTIAAREAVGPDFPLIADANQGWDYDTAFRYGKGVEKTDLLFYEQPVKAWDIRSLSMLRKNLQMKISADESITSIHDAINLVKDEACDIFSIKTSKHGGILPAKQICEYAYSNGIQLFFNSMIEGGITQSASLNIALTSNIMQTTGHSFFSTLRHKDDVTDFSDLIENAIVKAPSEPGLGIHVFDEKIKKYEKYAIEIQ